MKKQVLFDSSFLIAVVERPTTWFEDITEQIGGFEPVVLDCVLQELRKLASRSDRRARFASLAMQLAGDFKIVTGGGLRPDDEMVSYAKGRGALLATLDRELIALARAAGVKVLTLRRGRTASV